MKVINYGHACLMVEVNSKKLLFDPFITANELAKHIDVSNIKPDYIFISHGHQDHLADVELIAKISGAILISNFEIISWFAAKGFENGHPMNHGGIKAFDFGTVKMVNAIHSSSFPDGSYAGNPAGFVIESSEGNFYFAGDTALTMDMQIIPKFIKLDFAMLPLGDNFTMGIDEAVVAADWIGCKNIIGMHYDTFGYIIIDHEKAKASFKKAGLLLHLLEIGQSIEI